VLTLTRLRLKEPRGSHHQMTPGSLLLSRLGPNIGKSTLRRQSDVSAKKQAGFGGGEEIDILTV
jgi:hypothetical protein